MAKLLLSLTILAVGYQLAESTSCMEARNKCSHRIGCSMAMNNFNIACAQVKLGMVDYCTESCKRAVISLVTVQDDIGTDILTCDCAGSEDCQLQRDRISVCSDDVLAALKTLDNEDVISCSLARMLCEANTQCYTALGYYEENCENLWLNGHKSLECSQACNNSLNILNRQPRAVKLENCLCDNTDTIIDENTCIRMKYNTKTYCQNNEPDDIFYVNNVIKPSESEDSQTKDDSYNGNMKIKINTAPVVSSGSRITISSVTLISIFLSATWFHR